MYYEYTVLDITLINYWLIFIEKNKKFKLKFYMKELVKLIIYFLAEDKYMEKNNLLI